MFSDVTFSDISISYGITTPPSKVRLLGAYYIFLRRVALSMSLADELLADLDDIGDELANDTNEQVIGW